MLYRTYIPSAPLNQFITHFTYFKHYAPNHSIDRFLPNGNTEIVIDLTNNPKFIYDNETLEEIQACNKIWISGIRNKFICIPSGRATEMFILNFKKGMVRSFLRFPLHEITDTVVDGELILQKIFMELREMLLECTCSDEMFLSTEQLLYKNFRSSLAVNPVIEYSVQKIVEAPEAASIEHIANSTGYSSKHLIHLFKENVGVSPKAFLKIIRFQKAINEIETHGVINWSVLASDCGYYDQSHFIADFKNFSGFTPVEYMNRKKGDWLNYVPEK